MENNETGLVKSSGAKLPKFVEQAYDSIEGMKQFANMLLESKLVPDSYYEKGADNKPDYNKGKTSAVVIVLLQAQQLAVPPMTGLQHIVPVNGLLSIKGDLAKTMIFASGKLKKDSWVETVTGTIEDENMVVTITATREDNGITTTRSFSVDKAKRMGLWITSAQVSGTDGWKHKKSAWYKTPDRMIFYRCLGNLARDLFSDVLLNMYTTEEAVDIQNDVTTVIDTESGAKIIIPDKDHSKARSSKMTDRVSDKIPDNKFGSVRNENIQEATVVDDKANGFTNPLKDAIDKSGADAGEVLEAMSKAVDKINEDSFVPQRGSSESMGGQEISRETAPIEEKEELPGSYTLVGLEKMETEVLKKIVMDDMDSMEACEIMGGKNTKQKLAKIIFAHQSGELAQLVAPYIKENEEKAKQFEASQAEQASVTPPPANTSAGEISPNKSFDAPAEHKGTPTKNANLLEPETKKSANKYAIAVPDYDKDNARDFSTVKTLFNKLMGVTPQITTPVYMALAEKLGLLTKYPDKEGFLKLASVDEINLLLNAN